MRTRVGLGARLGPDHCRIGALSHAFFGLEDSQPGPFHRLGLLRGLSPVALGGCCLYGGVEASQKSVELAVDEFDRLNSNRLMLHSARILGETKLERQALENLLSLRPQELRWQEEHKRLEVE